MQWIALTSSAAGSAWQTVGMCSASMVFLILGGLLEQQATTAGAQYLGGLLPSAARPGVSSSTLATAGCCEAGRSAGPRPASRERVWPSDDHVRIVARPRPEVRHRGSGCYERSSSARLGVAITELRDECGLLPRSSICDDDRVEAVEPPLPQRENAGHRAEGVQASSPSSTIPRRPLRMAGEPGSLWRDRCRAASCLGRRPRTPMATRSRSGSAASMIEILSGCGPW